VPTARPPLVAPRLRTCNVAAASAPDPVSSSSEIREEMRQVSWPTRPEVINYTTIVFFVLVFMTSLIFGLGYGFSKFVTFLFTK
jgi:preprotein translocase subunit SecE